MSTVMIPGDAYETPTDSEEAGVVLLHADLLSLPVSTEEVLEMRRQAWSKMSPERRKEMVKTEVDRYLAWRGDN